MVHQLFHYNLNILIMKLIHKSDGCICSFSLSKIIEISIDQRLNSIPSLVIKYIVQ